MSDAATIVIADNELKEAWLLALTASWPDWYKVTVLSIKFGVTGPELRNRLFELGIVVDESDAEEDRGG